MEKEMAKIEKQYNTCEAVEKLVYDSNKEHPSPGILLVYAKKTKRTIYQKTIKNGIETFCKGPWPIK